MMMDGCELRMRKSRAPRAEHIHRSLNDGYLILLPPGMMNTPHLCGLSMNSTVPLLMISKDEGVLWGQSKAPSNGLHGGE